MRRQPQQVPGPPPSMGRDKVAYFYDSACPRLLRCTLRRTRSHVQPPGPCAAGDIGFNHYGPRHPMKPIRLDMTHHLIVGYELHKHMEVYVRPRRLRQPALRAA